MNVKITQNADAELSIQRVFNAPRDLVLEMWTRKEHLDRWSCPDGMTIPVSEGDIRTGGWFRTCMRGNDGSEYWVSGTYHEVSPERIVFTHAWDEESGERGHETVVTIAFSDTEDGKTHMHFHQAFFTSTASRDGHAEGWKACFEKLDKLLSQTA
ncbi:SRPBCC domain-containing protein [Nitratireductor kimnyeongensis]|uniref:SRPBCC domain-containing protein n=1 Tax=Nitratireductor kimnyeongensis TaxID=430679 RepID=A0ABW0TA87_9HYPH|nr:SRPBCC domain-containing protein [Nitratireductor kimnyeongensis]QZZ36124.1 SRPBCC domain-containing protein [Nitratireductor kimnyeongensis]